MTITRERIEVGVMIAATLAILLPLAVTLGPDLADPLPTKPGETFHSFGQRRAERAAERGY